MSDGSENKWPNLTVLLGQQDQPPTLSEIAHAWSLDTKLVTARHQEVWPDYDFHFHGRPDYQLWRCKPRDSSTSSPLEWAATLGSQHDIALKGLRETTNLAILWGVLLQTYRLLVNWNSTHYPPETYQELIAESERHLKLAPLKKAHCACAFIRLLLRSAIDRAYEHLATAHGGMAYTDPEFVRRLLDDYESLIQREIDPQWKPGIAIALSGLRSDRRYLLVLGNRHNTVLYLAEKLGEVFSRGHSAARGMCRHRPYHPDLDELLVRGWKWAMSAWRQKRARRLYAEAHSVPQQQRMYSDEMHHLSYAAGAAQAAGLYIKSAGLSYLLLQTARADWLQSTETREWSWLERIRNKPYHVIRQTGLIIPKRWDDVSRSPSEGRGDDRRSPPEAATSASVGQIGGQPQRGREGSLCNGPSDRLVGDDPYDLRRYYSYYRDSHGFWNTLREATGLPIESNPSDVMSCAYDFVRNWRCHTPHVMDALFELCLEFGELASASYVLQRRYHWLVGNTGHGPLPESEVWTVSKSQLIRFAEAVAKAAQIMPHAMNLRTHDGWRWALAMNWGTMSREQAWTFEERLTMHEAMLGVCTAHLLNADDAAPLVRQYYDGLKDDEIRRLCDGGREFTRQGVAASDKDDIRNCVARI